MKAIVYGPPASMGSKRAFICKGRPILVDVKAKQLRSFQAEMRSAMSLSKPETLITNPVTLCVRVYAQRPKGHYGTGKNANVLKANAPKYCATKPDLDKVIRAVQDCATGIWFRDDSQVVNYDGSIKIYTESEPRVEVELCDIDDADPFER